MTLETTKILGGIGAVLLLVSPIGMQIGLAGIAGLILMLIALSRMAYHYKEPRIFNNAIYGAITAIAGIAIFAAIMLTTAYTLLETLGFTFSWGNWSIFQQIDWAKIFDWNIFWPYITAVIVAFVMLFVFFFIAGRFFKEAFNLLGEKTGVHAFHTAATLIFVGAILTIIAVGFILIWIALIFLAIAFFSIKTT